MISLNSTHRDDDRPVLLLGAGGHARVIISTLRAAGRTIAGVLDDNESLWGTTLMGLTIDGPIDRASDMPGCLSVAGVGNATSRRAIVTRLRTTWARVIHPFSYVDPTVTLGEGTVVFAGSVVQPECSIGKHCIINTGATVDHNCRLDPFVQIAPGAHLSGCVSVGEGTFIGVGATILESLQIGRWGLVGGGAVVIESLADGVVAVGCPTRIIRTVTLPD